MSTPEPYPMGARVIFADASATVSSDTPGLAAGFVNGPPVTDDDGAVLFVPVFAARDNGREATTVYVKVGNIAGVST